jgi:tetratricopeptide (TPR) repeat protein
MSWNRTTWFAAGLMLALWAASVITLRKVESIRGQAATLEEVLYVPSGRVLKKLSLGYSGLLADIYWTRAVQYFGSRHLKSATQYELLYPLLDITTDLDPHLVVAYQSGSIFLCQAVPEGAGEPEKAVALLQKGIRQNPGYWRLYFNLGFVHYVDLGDTKAAEEAFRKGSEVPGALPWMKVMAARMAERSDDLGTALALWQGLYQTSTDKDLKTGAIMHINSLRAEGAIGQLQQLVQTYRRKNGVLPSRWSELIQAGYLRGVPLDPTGEPFLLLADGTVQVKNPSQFPYLGRLRKEKL